MKSTAWYLFIIAIFSYSAPGQATSDSQQALEIIRKADDVRSPNEPFRYNVTVLEY